MRVLPLGDGSYKRFLGGDRRTTHGTREGFQSPKTLGEFGFESIKNEVKGEGLGSSLSFLRRPLLPTGAGGCEPTVPYPDGSKNPPGGS